MTRRDAFLTYLEHYIGKPYLWAGDDPLAGFDCSGLVCEGLQAVGVLPHGADFNAQGLMGKFPSRFAGEPVMAMPLPGDLVFRLNESGVAVHVEVVWRRPELSLGASGGDSKTTGEAEAEKQNAFVKIRPWARLGHVAFAVPMEDL